MKGKRKTGGGGGGGPLQPPLLGSQLDQAAKKDTLVVNAWQVRDRFAVASNYCTRHGERRRGNFGFTLICLLSFPFPSFFQDFFPASHFQGEKGHHIPGLDLCHLISLPRLLRFLPSSSSADFFHCAQSRRTTHKRRRFRLAKGGERKRIPRFIPCL